MKKLIYTLFLIGLFTSCDKDYTEEFAVDNKTSHSIQIKGYNPFELLYSGEEVTKTRHADFLNTVEVINIAPYSEFSVIKSAGVLHPDMPGIFENTGIDYSGIDSVTIVFDNQKIIVQYCDELRELATCDIERNIMMDDNEEYFEKTEPEKEITRYTYTITEADYERAVPIEAK